MDWQAAPPKASLNSSQEPKEGPASPVPAGVVCISLTLKSGPYCLSQKGLKKAGT